LGAINPSQLLLGFSPEGCGKVAGRQASHRAQPPAPFVKNQRPEGSLDVYRKSQSLLVALAKDFAAKTIVARKGPFFWYPAPKVHFLRKKRFVAVTI
jgi:hypothetical protein